MLFDLTSEEQGEFSHGQTWGEIWKWFLEELTADTEAKEPEAERTGFPGSELGSAGGARLSPGPVLSLPLVNPHPGHWSGGGFFQDADLASISPGSAELSITAACRCLPSMDTHTSRHTAHTCGR